MAFNTDRYRRYTFRRTFGFVAGVYMAMMLLEFITLSVLSLEYKEVRADRFSNPDTLLNLGISFLFHAAFLYFTLNAFYRRIAARKKFFTFAPPVALGVIAQGTYHCLMFFLLERDNLILSLNDVKARDELPVGLMFFSYLTTAALFIGISLLVAYLTYLRDERKQNKLLKEQKMQLEIEKSQANFNFLKAQINPHFLHNTLNFLYARSLPYSSEVSQGILILSHIMRYALSEGNAKDGKALLADEIQHLHNVIKINQLRFSNKLNVQLQVDGCTEGVQIIPFVLITLVENALKHGDMRSSRHPGIFRISVAGKKFCFYGHNKKKTGSKEPSTGIGLDNIKKQLHLAYGDHHHFLIREDAEFYTTQLTIDPL